jgi:phosphatidylserine/phosphatidylglycerophosphate/cardiolipin synthase-like enzyme
MAPKFLPGNQLTLLNSGAEYFPALIAAIDEARHDVHLESYIFEDDATGRAVADAIANAARRGVTVRVLVDGFGAPEFADRLQPGAGGGRRPGNGLPAGHRTLPLASPSPASPAPQAGGRLMGRLPSSAASMSSTI